MRHKNAGVPGPLDTDLSMDAATREEVADFLRKWLPPSARETYARLIRNDPAGWSRHPHFRGGVIVRCALRGNGFTERLLGVSSLDEVWPELLERAVSNGGAPAHQNH